MTEANFQCKAGVVEYYDSKIYDGELTLFHKEKIFQYQNEYRILVASRGTEPLRIVPPGLKETSILVHTSELNNYNTVKELLG